MMRRRRIETVWRREGEAKVSGKPQLAILGGRVPGTLSRRGRAFVLRGALHRSLAVRACADRSMARSPAAASTPQPKQAGRMRAGRMSEGMSRDRAHARKEGARALAAL